MRKVYKSLIRPFGLSLSILGSRRPNVDHVANTDRRAVRQVEQAVDERVVGQAALLWFTLGDVFLKGFQNKIQSVFTHNNGVLCSVFDLVVQKELIAARGALDILTLSDSTVDTAFGDADSMRPLDIAFHVVRLVATGNSLWTQLSIFREAGLAGRVVTSRYTIACAFAASLLEYFHWFVVPPSTERIKVTHFAYKRFTELSQLSYQGKDSASSAAMKLLSMEQYLLNQFDLTRKNMEGLAHYQNRTQSLLQFALEVCDYAWPVILRTSFAMQALRDKSRPFNLIRLSNTIYYARAIAGKLSSLISTIDDVREDCSKIKSYYEALKVEGRIRDPLQPRSYTTQKGDTGTGMKIEFKDVSFGYSGTSGPLALRKLNFAIQPGSLVCIVGGNGAGKVSWQAADSRPTSDLDQRRPDGLSHETTQSTLIKLLTRLYEPTTGSILVNDAPIGAYAHAELLRNITVQLQHVPVSKVTIAEFVWLGAVAQRPNEKIDVPQVIKALEKADAMSFINTLDKGIWARLGPVSIDTLVVADTKPP